MIGTRLERIQEIAAAGLLDWRELPPGLSNRSFVVGTRRGRWVLRLNGEVPGVDRQTEARVLAAAATAGLAPPIIACDPARGYLITEYVDAPAWRAVDLRRPDRQYELAGRLRRLHRLDVAVPALDVGAALREYRHASAPEHRRVLATAGAALLAELERQRYFEHPAVLCHHDLHAGNIIGHPSIRFLDWEFACRGHPALDLGFIIQYHDLPAAAAAGLVGAYYGERDAGNAVPLAVRLACLLELSWLAARDHRRDLPALGRRRLKRLWRDCT